MTYRCILRAQQEAEPSRGGSSCIMGEKSEKVCQVLGHHHGGHGD